MCGVQIGRGPGSIGSQYCAFQSTLGGVKKQQIVVGIGAFSCSRSKTVEGAF